jgi:hypothetical protein
VSHGTDQADAAPTSFTVVAGDPTPAELAAVTAVLGAVLEEIANDRELGTVPGVSAWQRSQRPIRGAITRGNGAWRAFSG